MAEAALRLHSPDSPSSPAPGERAAAAAGPDDRRLIARLELYRRAGISEAAGDRAKAAGRIGPRPVRIAGCVRYHLEEVVAWLAHPDPAGELLGAAEWPAVWESLKRAARRK